MRRSIATQPTVRYSAHIAHKEEAAMADKASNEAEKVEASLRSSVREAVDRERARL